MKLTKRQIDWIKKVYVKTILKREELLKKFNKKFNKNLSIYQLAEKMTEEKIRKDEIFRKELLRLSRNKKRSFIFTKEVTEFLKKCIDDGMSANECKEKCQTKFGRNFLTSSIRQIAYRNKWYFCTLMKLEIDDIFDNPGMLKIVKNALKIAKRKENYYPEVIVIRDAIIEKLGKNVCSRDIRIYCRKNDIKIKDNCRDTNEYQKRRYNEKKFYNEFNWDWSPEREMEFA